ncbi:MAG: Ig-like domain-containing protein [Pseudomonadota bacterium]
MNKAALRLAFLWALFLGAAPAWSTEGALSVARDQLAVLESQIGECTIAKAIIERDGGQSSKLRCYVNENGRSLFSLYRKILIDLDLFNRGVRAAYNALSKNALACRNRKGAERPPLERQLSCIGERFDEFVSVLDPDAPADVAPPALVMESPVDGDLVALSGALVSGRVSDAQSLVTRVSINGVVASRLANGGFAATIDFRRSGPGRVEVTAWDAAGNAASVVIPVVVDGDLFVPVYEQELAALNMTVNACAAARIEAEAAGRALPNCLEVDGEGVFAAYRRLLRRENLYSLTVRAGYMSLRIAVRNCIASTDAGLPPLPVQLACTDDAFDLFLDLLNPGGGGTRDTTPPVLVITEPLVGGVLNTGSVRVSGTATDEGTGVSRVTVNGASAELVDGGFSLLVALAEGANELVVVARDRAGNETRATVSVVLDTISPQIEVLAPGADAFVSTPSIELQVRFTDAGSGINRFSIAGEVFEATGASVVGTKSVDLEAGENLIELSARDAAGNEVNGTYAIVLDTTPPELEISTPADGAVVTDATVSVGGTVADLESGVTSLTLNGDALELPGDGTGSFSTMLTLEPGANTVRVLAINGAGLSVERTVSVTYDAMADVVPPMLDRVYPADLAADVSLNARVILRFSEPVALPGSMMASLSTDVDGTLPLTAKLSPDALSVTLTPQLNLRPNTPHTLVVEGVTDEAGNALAGAVTSTFTTGAELDEERPRILAVSVPSGATIPVNAVIQAVFSERMDPASVNIFPLQSSGALSIVATSQLDPSGRVLSIVPERELPVGESIRIVDSSVRDAQGNRLFSSLSQSARVSFESDVEAPTLISVLPRDESTAVALNARIWLAFDEPIYSNALQSAVAVTDSSGVAVPGSASLTNGNQVLVFRPSDLLAAETAYTVSLAEDLVDQAGNPLVLAETRLVSFVTGDLEDGDRPAVPVLSLPLTREENPIAVPNDAVLRVDFGETLAPLPDMLSSLTVEGATVPASFTAQGGALTLVPEQPLAPGSRYRWLTQGTLTDVAGNTNFVSRVAYFVVGDYPEIPSAGVDLAGRTEVPTNARIEVAFDAALDLTSVAMARIEVSSNGELLDHSVFSVTSDGVFVLRLAVGNLPETATIRVAIDGLRDLSGRPVPAIDTSFSTGTERDIARPQLVSAQPEPDATDVAPGTPLVFTFDEPLRQDVGGLSSNHVALVRQSGSRVELIELPARFEIDGSTLTVTTSDPLPSAATIDVRINAITDLSGIRVFYQQRFSTAANPDLPIARLVEVLPAGGRLNSAEREIVLRFSAPIDPQTVNRDAIGVFVDGRALPFTSFSRANFNRDLLISGISSAGGDTLQIDLSNIRDLSGSGVDVAVVSFDLVDDSESARVLAVRPARGAREVSPTTSIDLYLGQQVNLETIDDSAYVSEDGVLVGGAWETNDAGLLRFTAERPFAPSSRVEVFLEPGIESLSGEAVGVYRSSFNVAAPADGLFVQAFSPSSALAIPTDTEFEVLFSERLDPASVTADTVRLEALATDGPRAAVPVSITLHDDGRRISISTANGLEADRFHSLTISRVRALDSDREASFQRLYDTGDSSVDERPPVIASILDGETPAPVNAIFSIQLDEPISEPSLFASRLADANGDDVPFSLSFDANSKRATIAPRMYLAPDSRYTLEFQGVRDRSGNETPYARSFQTSAALDLVDPTLVARSPVGEGAAASSVIEWTFSEPVSAVSDNAVRVSDRNGEIEGTATIDGRRGAFVPDRPLPAGRDVSVTLWVVDSANNTEFVSFSFEVGFAEDLASPQLVETSPRSEDLRVPVNGEFLAQYSEPLSAIALGGVRLLAGGEDVPAFVHLTDRNRRVVVRSRALLERGERYAVSLSGLTDVAGNLAAHSEFEFVVGDEFDTSDPEVRLSQPSDGADKVSPLTRLGVVFDGPLALPRFAEYTLSSRARAQTLAPAPGSDVDRILFALDEPLEPLTFYTLRWNGVRDLAGNIDSDRFEFVTGTASTDVTPGQARFAPAEVDAVASNTELSIEFDRPIDALGLDAAQVVLLADGVPVAVDYQLIEGGTRLVFEAELEGDRNYSVSVGGLSAADGTALDTLSYAFRTTADVDQSAPELVSFSVSEGESGVPLNATLRAVFSEPIRVVPGRFNRRVELEIVDTPFPFESIAVRTSIEGATLSVTPVDPLPGGARLRLSLGAVEDLSGNERSFLPSVTFTTALGSDETPPELLAVYPEDGNVGPDGRVLLQFSENPRAQTLTSTSIVALSGSEQQFVSISRIPESRQVELRISRSSATADEPVELVLTDGITDLAGNALVPQVLNLSFVDLPSGVRFDRSRPSDAVLPAGGRPTLTAIYSEPLSSESLDGVVATIDGVVAEGDAMLVGEGRAVAWRPSLPLPPNADVELYLRGLSATDGELADDRTLFYRTDGDEDSAAPELLSDSLVAFELPTNVMLDFLFDRPLASVDPTIVLRLADSGLPVAIRAQYLDDNRRLRVTPSETLAANTRYSLAIVGLEGANGSPVAGLFRSFRTLDGPDGVAPALVRAAPHASSEKVPMNAGIFLSFSEAVNPAQLSQATLQLLDPTGVEVPYSLWIESANQIVRLVPDELLQLGAEYTLSAAQVADLAGNAVGVDLRFTVSGDVDTLRPVAVLQTPTGSGVATNAPIVARFDEAVVLTSLPSSTNLRDDTQGRIPGALFQNDESTAVTFLPSQNLAIGRGHSVSLTVRDLAGNSQSTFYSFSTGFDVDQAPPRLVAASPDTTESAPRNVTLLLSFDEAVAPDSVRNLVAFSGSDSVRLVPRFANDGRLLILSPNLVLAGGADWQVDLSGITDVAGNPVDAAGSLRWSTDSRFDFVTAALVETSLDGGSTLQPRNARVTVRFAEPMSAATFDGLGVVDQRTGVRVPGTVSYGDTTSVLVWTPVELLDADSQYMLSVDELADRGGNLRRYFTRRNFATSSEVDETLPLLLTTSVASAADLPANLLANLRFSEAVSRTSLQAVAIFANGVEVDANLQLSSDGQFLTVTPVAGFSVGVAYSIRLDGLQDLAGNRLAAAPLEFAIAADADEDRSSPRIASSLPVDDAVAVATDRPINLVFDELIDTSRVTSDSASLRVPSAANAYVPIDIQAAGRSMNITPLVDLPGDAVVQLSAQVYDLAGNRNSNVRLRFETGSAVDIEPPALLAIAPEQGSVVPSTAFEIGLLYSEPLNPSTLTRESVSVFVDGELRTTNPRVSTDGLSFRLTGRGSSARSSVVELRIDDTLTDLSGNTASPLSLRFTTQPQGSSSTVRLIRQIPGLFGTLGEGQRFTLLMSGALDLATVAAGIYVSVDGALAEGDLLLRAGGTAIEFVPAESFAPGALIELFLTPGVLDARGRPVQSYTGRARVAGTIDEEFRLIATSTLSEVPTNAVIDLGFNAPVDPDSISDVTVKFEDTGGAVVAASRSLSSDGMRIRLMPIGDLQADTSYTIDVNGLSARDGRSVRRARRDIRTTAGRDDAAPEILLPVFAGGALPSNMEVVVEATEAISLLTLGGTTIELLTDQGESVPVAVERIARDPYALSIKSQVLLADGGKYSLRITGVEDFAGNAAESVSIDFVTSNKVDVASPTLVSRLPDVSGVVPTNALVQLQFSETLAGEELINSAISLREGFFSSGPLVSGASVYDPITRVYTFTPDQPLDTETTYRLAFGSGDITDLAGNRLSTSGFTFRTGTAPDDEPPRLLNSEPRAGALLPINATTFVLRFDQALSEFTDSSVSLLANSIPVPISVRHLRNPGELEVMALELLPPDALTELFVGQPIDTTGNVAPPLTLTYQTAAGVDLRGPSLLASSPVDDAVDVPIDATIRLQFDEEMSIPSLQSSLSLRDRVDFETVDLVVRAGDAPGLVLVQPQANLRSSTLYDLRASGFSIRDLANNAADESIFVRFETR